MSNTKPELDGAARSTCGSQKKFNVITRQPPVFPGQMRIAILFLH